MHNGCSFQTDLTSSAKRSIDSDARQFPGLLEISTTNSHLTSNLLCPVTNNTDVQTEIVLLWSLRGAYTRLSCVVHLGNYDIQESQNMSVSISYCSSLFHLSHTYCSMYVITCYICTCIWYPSLVPNTERVSYYVCNSSSTPTRCLPRICAK